MIYLRDILDRLRGRYSKEPIEAVEQAWRELDGKTVELEPITDFDELLHGYIEAGIPLVRVLSQRDDKTCAVCFDHDGTEYPIGEAIKTKPLPHKGCTNDECRCDYLPIIRD